MTAILDGVVSVEEYLDMEEVSQAKHEFYNGKVVEMPGGSTTHNQISARLIAMLVHELDEAEKDYIVYSSDMKIQIPKYNHFVYPGAVVVCEKPEFYKNRKDAIINPLLIIEVLSPKTEEYDKGHKFLKYKTLPPFKEYVLVRQDKPYINTFFRSSDTTWEEIEASNLAESILLKSINVALDLSRVYKKVRFE
ncbi:MAG: Uma2 family endonuclease [Bacteroidota bacterium]